MTDLEYIANKIEEYSGKDIEMTPKRVRELASYLGSLKELIETNSGISWDKNNFHFRNEDLENVGEMDFLLERFYPDGNVPMRLKKYKDFVDNIKGIDVYHKILEAKLQRDAKILRNKDSVSEADDMIYARAIVGIIESDQLVPERSRVLVTFEGNSLYEENIPEYVFRGLPERSTLVFEYTSQGLALDLKRTLEESKSNKADINRTEKVIINSLAADPQSKEYVDSVYDGINNQLDK